MSNALNISTAHPTKFRLVFPYLDFLDTPSKGEDLLLYCTEAQLPSIGLAIDKVGNPFYEMKLANGSITFGDMVVTYVVDELFTNYRFLYSWMMYIKNPERFKVNNPQVDATLHIYSNNGNPKVKMTLKNITPIGLSEIQFSTKVADAKDIENKATFSVEYFQLEPLEE